MESSLQVFSGLGICISETVFNFFFFFLLLDSLSLRVLLPHSHRIFYGTLHTWHFAHVVGSSLLPLVISAIGWDYLLTSISCAFLQPLQMGLGLCE